MNTHLEIFWSQSRKLVLSLFHNYWNSSYPFLIWVGFINKMAAPSIHGNSTGASSFIYLHFTSELRLFFLGMYTSKYTCLNFYMKINHQIKENYDLPTWSFFLSFSHETYLYFVGLGLMFRTSNLKNTPKANKFVFSNGLTKDLLITFPFLHMFKN